MGTDFGEVGSVRLAFDGHGRLGIIQAKRVVQFVQDTIQGTFEQRCDSVFAWLEQLGANNAGDGGVVHTHGIHRRRPRPDY